MAAVTSNKDTWSNMLSKLEAMGGVSKAVLGEPTTGIQSGLVAIIPENGRIDETTLSGPREVHVVTLRRYEQRMKEPVAATEEKLDQWRFNIARDIFGDFDLGGSVAYALPTEFAWAYGYQTIENSLYRLLDLTVAYRVDDRATFTA